MGTPVAGLAMTLGVRPLRATGRSLAGLTQMSDAVAHAVITSADSPAVAAMAVAGHAIVQQHEYQRAGMIAA